MCASFLFSFVLLWFVAVCLWCQICCIFFGVGLVSLLPAIQCMHSSPTKLNLCHTGITSRGVNRLMDVVQLKCEMSDVLQMLDLSDNCLKAEDPTVSVSGRFFFAYGWLCYWTKSLSALGCDVLVHICLLCYAHGIIVIIMILKYVKHIVVKS